MYHIEHTTQDSKFTSIPFAMWWGIVTITTVGYGDVHPETTEGKLFAGCFMAFGVVTLSLPVLAIVTKFELFYEKNIKEGEREIESEIQEDKEENGSKGALE